MMKSIGAVLIGILLALGIGALVIFGIAAPFFTRFFGPELASTALPAAIVIFGAAFAFYFGGMVASYKAPSRRRLHGVLVGVVSFVVSPVVNVAASVVGAGGADPLANLRTPGTLLLTGVLFAVVLTASYVGARRGEALFVHNQRYVRTRARREKS